MSEPNGAAGPEPSCGVDDELLFFSAGSAVFLRRFLWLLLGVMLVLSLQAAWVIGPQALWQGWDRIAIGAFSLLSLRLLRRRGVRLTVMVMLWGVWLVLGLAALLRGLHYPGLYAYPLFLLLAGWMLGKRHAYGMGLLTWVLLIVSAWLHAGNWLQGRPPVDPWIIVSTLGVVLTLGAVLVASVSDHVRRQYEQVIELKRTLERRVAERTEHLETALRELQRTQDDLVASQKLASLGALVAGVAHELNTPIGNAVTAASALHDRVNEFAGTVTGRHVQRAGVKEFVEVAQGLSAVVQSAAQRAGALVTSFKQVAVDRSSEQRRAFDLAVAVHDLVVATAPLHRNKPWRIEIDVPPGLAFDSFPGPLEQVLTNLIQNAERHAFAGRAQGVVRIAACALPGERVQISVSDDGQGMAPEVAARIFEPFFTTRLGQGGSGLGLSIAHSIVSGLLGGAISVSSQPGQGTRFLIDIPLQAPRAEPATPTGRPP